MWVGPGAGYSVGFEGGLVVQGAQIAVGYVSAGAVGRARPVAGRPA